MKFQIGSKVEVLSRKKTPSGAWRLAEVVSDNGDEYIVRYERYFGISKGTTERVKKDIVRPCPPLVKGVADCTVGDIVEVLDDSYWKVAVIESVEGEGFYVRVLGSFDEFKVQRGSIRVRQAWEDNKWIVLDKDSNVCEDLISKAQRTLKRAFADSDAHLDTYYGNCQKSRAVEADGQCGGKVLVCSSSNTTKVDGAVYMQVEPWFRQKQGSKDPLEGAFFAILWVLWIERNSHICQSKKSGREGAEDRAYGSVDMQCLHSASCRQIFSSLLYISVLIS